MKTRAMFAAVAAVMILSAGSVMADEPSQKVTSVDERVNDVDLNILIELYRKVRTQWSELRLQMELSPAEGVTQSDKEKGLQERQKELLAQQCRSLRDAIATLGELAERMKDSIALYRKSSAELEELRLQEAAGVTIPDKEKGFHERRLNFLERQTDQSRARITDLRDQIGKMVERAQK